VWLVLLAAVWLVGCDNADGDDDNPAASGVDGDTGGDDDYPDDLDDCAPYYELDPWFDFTEVNEAEAVAEFYQAFGDNFTVGVVLQIGDQYRFRIGDWKVDIVWLTTEFDPPFADGQSVKIYMGPGEEWDCKTPRLWVLDEHGGLLLYLAHRYWSESVDVGEHTLRLHFKYACEYRNDQPPDRHDGPWLRVFSFAVQGNIDGHAFDVSVWDAEAATQDGALRVQLPYAYYGEVDAEPAVCIDTQHQGEALLQIVRSP
jgi:hypothetical protein